MPLSYGQCALNHIVCMQAQSIQRMSVVLCRMAIGMFSLTTLDMHLQKGFSNKGGNPTFGSCFGGAKD